MAQSRYVSSALLVLVAASSSAFVLPPRSLSTSTTQSVVSRDVEEATQSSYQKSRGDGSTGGGGLAMPNIEEDDGLVRPKVRVVSSCFLSEK